MIVTFDEQYLENLYTKGDSGEKKYRFQPEIVRGYRLIIINNDSYGKDYGYKRAYS